MFLAVLSDRHRDPQYKFFNSVERAIACCNQFMQDNMAHPENIEKLDMAKHGNYLFLTYPEGDFATVIEIEIEVDD